MCKKDVFQAKHGAIDVPNLHVMKALLSLKSRGYVTEIFSWQYFYYTLTESGIEYLREYLHVPAEYVPLTLQKQNKPQTRPSFGNFGGDRERRGDRKDGYRSKKTGADGDFNPEFVSIPAVCVWDVDLVKSI